MDKKSVYIPVSEVAARVIMIHDGSIHILFDENNCFVGTVENLSMVLTNADKLYNKHFKEYEDTCYEVNPSCLRIDLVPGIDMALIKKNQTVILKHPVLLSLVFDHWSEDKKTKPLVLEENSNYLKSGNPLVVNLRNYLEMGRVMRAVTKSGLYELADSNNEILSALQRMADRLPGNYVTALDIEKRFPAFKDLIALNENISDENGTDDDFLLCNDISDNTETDEPLKKLTEYHVPIEEYAKICQRAESTVRGWISRGDLKTAVMVAGKWYIDSREIKADKRIRAIGDGSASLNKKPRKRRKQKKTDSYADLQMFLKEEGKFGDSINPYIYDYEEYKYYAKKHHEVNWGRPALIIPVDFDYYSSLHKKTNRQIILDGDSPVIPGDETHVYHIHHVGRKSGPDAPFAIIPETHHSKFFAILHKAPTPTENLHGKDFESEKREFWKTYLRMELEYGSFQKIPHKNRK